MWDPTFTLNLNPKTKSKCADCDRRTHTSHLLLFLFFLDITVVRVVMFIHAKGHMQCVTEFESAEFIITLALWLTYHNGHKTRPMNKDRPMSAPSFHGPCSLLINKAKSHNVEDGGTHFQYNNLLCYIPSLAVISHELNRMHIYFWFYSLTGNGKLMPKAESLIAGHLIYAWMSIRFSDILNNILFSLIVPMILSSTSILEYHTNAEYFFGNGWILS